MKKEQNAAMTDYTPARVIDVNNIKQHNMRKVFLVFAVLAIGFASCQKTEPDNGSETESENITLNITVAGLWSEESATKAQVKTGWVSGDQISIWYDSNQGDTPDIVITYDGSRWVAPESIAAPKYANGYAKCLYDGRVKVASKVGYIYDRIAATIDINIDSWTFLTEIQLVVESMAYDNNTTCTLACDRLAPCTGYIVNADEIVANIGSVGEAVTGIENQDGTAFVFGTSDSYGSDTDYTFTLTEGGTTKFHVESGLNLTEDAGKIIRLKIAYDSCYEKHDWVQLWENGPKFATMNLGETTEIGNAATYIWSESGSGNDVATKYWGSDWRVPTKDEMNELCLAASSSGSDKISCQFTSVSGVSGFLFKGKQEGYTDHSLFLPATIRIATYWSGSGNGWSGSTTGFSGWCLYLFYDSGFSSYWYEVDTSDDCFIRPVLKD